MCGIAGLFDTAISAEALPDTIVAMLGNIGHRGPDGLGYAVGNDWAMGTARLAIIDIEAGTQPMADPDGRFWLCYNGEIYNYRELRDELESLGVVFRTRCDTEVVLAAWMTWGDRCLPRLNGCFAFALFDRHRKRLVLARDRFGKRPLFYARRGTMLVFASEMKAFLSIPGFTFEQDPAQLASILGQWTPLPDQTGFSAIHSLPMGEWLSFEGGALARHAYAPLAFADGPPPASEGEARDMIRHALSDSVALRLRSDVEVGVYLSGGIDSAIIARLTRDISGRPPATFSVGFDDTELDESADQQKVADYLGTSHHTLRISHDDIAAACPEAIYHAEMPAFRSAFVPMFLLSRRTRELGIKVILSGEGADEAFLGYDLFKETLLRHSWNDIDEDDRRHRLSHLYPHLGHYGPQDIAALTGLYQQFSQERMPGLFSHELRFQNGRFSSRLIKGGHDPFGPVAALVAEHGYLAPLSPVQRAQWLEYKTLLPGYLLSTQGDRVALAHGVENRCPFLDPKVFDLASTLNLRFDDGFEEKRLMRQAFTGLLPQSVIDKRKFPYRAPDAAAFAETRPDYLELVRSDDELAKLPFLDAGFARRLSAKVLSRPANEISTKENQTFLFLLSIALLHRYFVSREGVAGHEVTRPHPPLVRSVDLRDAA